MANYGMPDSLVKLLLPDNGGSLWVMVSDGLTVFENSGRPTAPADHLPTVKYLSQSGNAIL